MALDFYFWLKGLLMGFIVSAPMGPVGVLVIKRVLNKGLFQGYITGLGASLGDAFYAALAAFGLSFLTGFLEREKDWLRLIGGVFLIGVGIVWLRKKKSFEDFKAVPEKSEHFVQVLTSAFFLDLANPFTLVVYIALISSFAFSHTSPLDMKAWAIVIGIAMGAAVWWLILIHLVALFRKKLTARSLQILNHMTAWLVILFGGFILITLLFPIKVFGKTL